jgi:hypothetical protein
MNVLQLIAGLQLVDSDRFRAVIGAVRHRAAMATSVADDRPHRKTVSACSSLSQATPQNPVPRLRQNAGSVGMVLDHIADMVRTLPSIPESLFGAENALRLSPVRSDRMAFKHHYRYLTATW